MKLLATLALLSLTGCYAAHERPGSLEPTDASAAPTDVADAGSATPSWPEPPGTLVPAETATLGQADRDEGFPKLGWLDGTLRIAHDSWTITSSLATAGWGYRRLDATLGELGIAELPGLLGPVAWNAEGVMGVVTYRFYPTSGPGEGATFFQPLDAMDAAARGERFDVPGRPNAEALVALSDGWLVLHHDDGPRAGILRLSRLDARGALRWQVDLGEGAHSGSAALVVDGADAVVAAGRFSGGTQLTRVSLEGDILAVRELPETSLALDLSRAPDGTFGLVAAVWEHDVSPVRLWHLGPTLEPIGEGWTEIASGGDGPIVLETAPDGWVTGWKEWLEDSVNSIRVAHLAPDGALLEPVHSLTDAAPADSGLGSTWGGDSLYFAWSRPRERRYVIEVSRLRWVR